MYFFNWKSVSVLHQYNQPVWPNWVSCNFVSISLGETPRCGVIMFPPHSLLSTPLPCHTWIQRGRQHGTNEILNQSLKSFTDYWGEGYRSPVIQTCHLGVLGDRNNNRHLEAGTNNRRGQAEVGDVREHTCKLWVRMQPGIVSGLAAVWILTPLKYLRISARSVDFKSNIKYVQLTREGVKGVICTAGSPFEVCKSLPYTSHSIVVELIFLSILILPLDYYNGFREVIAGFPVFCHTPGVRNNILHRQGSLNVVVNARL